MTMDISELVSFKIDVEKINIEEVMKHRYKILKARKLTHEKIGMIKKCGMPLKRIRQIVYYKLNFKLLWD